MGSTSEQNISLLFNSDIVDFLFKTNEGEIEGLILLFFVVWGTLIVSEWVVMV